MTQAQARVLTPEEQRIADFYQDDFKQHLEMRALCFDNVGYWDEQTHDLDAAGRNLLRELVARGGIAGAGRVLDVGCGPGQTSIDLHRVHGCAQVLGIDLGNELLDHARELASRSGVAGAVEFRQMNAVGLELEDGSFDAVVASDCGVQFRTRESFYREALRVLRPGGVLVMADTFVASDPPGIFNRVVKTQLVRFWAVPVENLYSHEHAAGLMRAAGFERVTSESVVDRATLRACEYITGADFRPRFAAKFGRFKTDVVMFIYGAMARACRDGLLDFALLVAHKPEK